MDADTWKIIAGVLLLIGIVLSILLVLYTKQMKSICHQLRIHRTEDSNTDIWLDIIKGVFGELQRELNLSLKEQREERKEHRYQEQVFRELVSNVSHDIRTPITSISGYFQLFLETEEAEKREQYAQIITGRLKSFQVMLEEFYDYSTIISNDRKIEIEKCDVTRLVSEVLFLYYREIEETLGEPQIFFPEKEVYVFASDSGLRRVIQNVINNTLRHGCGGFKVAIEVDTHVRIRFENQTRERLPDKPERVFERTYKADEARNSMSSGLGLSIVKELIEKMGGVATVYTAPDNIFGIWMELEKCE